MRLRPEKWFDQTLKWRHGKWRQQTSSFHPFRPNPSCQYRVKALRASCPTCQHPHPRSTYLEYNAGIMFRLLISMMLTYYSHWTQYSKLTDWQVKSNLTLSSSCRPYVRNTKHKAMYVIMRFILTTGYIDNVYKSVSSKRKLTHPSDVCCRWYCSVCVSWAETLGGCCCYHHRHPPPSSSSEQQDTPRSRRTVQSEHFFFCLPSTAKWSFVIQPGTKTMTEFIDFAFLN